MKVPGRSYSPGSGGIIVLNCASSSGKTSLAKAMQSKSETPLHHVQLDAFRDMEPPGSWNDWEQREPPLAQKMMDALCGAMFAAMREYSRHGSKSSWTSR